MTRLRLLPALLFALIALTRADAQDAPVERGSPGWLLPLPEVDADPKIPTLEQVVGHAWAREISSPAQVERYLQALAAAAPERTKLVRYGESYEGRPLYYLVISSPENMARIDAVRADLLRLADPRKLTAEELARLVDTTPGAVWLSYGVHGDESSSTDAAALTAYTLLADRRESNRDMLRELVVIVDPVQNPDGRERFLSSFRENRGVFPSGERLASERTQRWAPGRYNHYLFDMNRDWFLQTQRETQGRVKAYLEWQPQVLVDSHEMGSASNYYFDPPADPLNPHISPSQVAWFGRIGRVHADRFDQYGFPYTTREMYDGFYPGYGSTWPTLHGAIGILWEQAGVRGLLINREDDTTLHFHDAVRHHYVSGMATLEAAFKGKDDLLRDFAAGRKAKPAADANATTDYFLLPGETPARASRLARLLIANGIEVEQLTAEVKVKGEGEAAERTIPAGAYRVSAMQPAAPLVRTLLGPGDDMGKTFIDRQLDRRARRLPDQIYDVTAWSLPMTFGIDCVRAQGPRGVQAKAAVSPEAPSSVQGPDRPRVGYLVEAGDEAAITALGAWLERGLRVHVLDQPTRLSGRSFGRGTLLLRTAENPPTLHQTIREDAATYGLSVLGTDTAFVEEGAALGGPNVSHVKPPRIVMAVGEPAGTAAGHTWYLFDQVWKYPVTRVNARYVGSRLNLEDYDVLILPAGSYDESDGFGAATATRLKDWVRRGGTLVLVGGAVSWAMGESVGLLPTEPRKKKVEPIPGENVEPDKKPAKDADAPEADEKPAGDEKPKGKGEGEKKEEKAEADKKDAKPPTETPDPVPGALLRVTTYPDHWVSFGLPAEWDLLMTGSLIVEPLKPTDGRNLVTFKAQEKPVAGFCWPATLELLGRSPYVVYRESGDGHIVGFTDDPNYRAQSPRMSRLFQNAVFFGPGH